MRETVLSSNACDSSRSAAAQTIPRVSAEIFIIPLEAGKYILYAPRRRAAFAAGPLVVNFLADLQEGHLNTHVDPDGSLTAFLRQLEFLDAGPEPLPVTLFEGDPAPTSVTLFLTTACNLRCTYCYASAGDTPRRAMSLETAMRGIDYVATNALNKGQPYFEIAYHGGGEPTVNWRVLTESRAYAQQKAQELGLDVFASSASNGVLNDTQIDWITHNLDGVSLSFDGLPSAHDRHRPMLSGKGSSERVMHTIRRFDAAGFPYGLRVTVTQDQIAFLPESVEYICRHFAATRIQVEPAYQMGRWQDSPSAETADFIEAYRAAQDRARHYGREILYSAARVGTLTNHFCGVTQDTFALSPDGNVSACYEVFAEDDAHASTFFYGKPEQENREQKNGGQIYSMDSGRKKGGYVFNLPVLNNLRQQAVQHRSYCQGCFAKWHCAGDCYHKALTVTEEKEFAGSDRCHITRELTKDQILAKIAEAGGLFWHEMPGAVASGGGKGKELFL